MATTDQATAEMKEEKTWAVTWGTFQSEVKKEGFIAAPMAAVSVLQYLLQLVSMIMAGHLDQLALSGVAIAISLTNVTGFSLLSGMAGGLETLCGQAFGAGQYQKLGTYTCTAMISLLLVCPPICVLWIFFDKLLPLVGQNPQISHEAQIYSVWLIPALFGGAILKPLTRYFQSQSSIFPMILSSFVILLFHILTSWAFIYKLELGVKGSAISFSLSTWLYVVLLWLYAMFSSSFEETRLAFSMESLVHIGQFFRLAIPSAVMICLKWWSCELIILLSGLLPNPKLETSVLSICLTISTLHFTISYGFGAAASIRVSNELGAGNPQAARVAVWAAMFLSITEAVIVSTTLFCCRYVLGHVFSSEKPVVDYVEVMAPLICISVFMDSLQAVLSGIARGSGWQHIGAYVNLGAFYLFGLPLGCALGFALGLRGKGLWIGIVAGSAVQSALLALVTCFTNWTKQAKRARERVFVEQLSEDSEAN
ncbi:protein DETOXIFICATION 8-like [Pyrus x bretschneideri]|uniref:protein DETOXIFICATION 8-like n=1 Tax=Pyrus x bretschneideri TaxID=225117 RepID=UPI00202E5C9D|nr:protein DETOXIFICATION 8-like [Pyrus x bretschneideri]